MGPKGPSAKGEAMTLEERVLRIEQYIGTSEPEVWVRLRDEIRASLDAPRAEAEPAPAERTVEAAITKASAARVAYGDGRVSVWREIEEVLVGSGTDVTKPIPTRIRFLVAEGKRLRAERDETRGEAARARANEIQMHTERDTARRERHETWENAARIVEAHIITGRAWTEEQEQAAKMLMDVAAAIRARAVADGKAGGEPAPTESANAKRLTIREAARNRQPLGGADAQALEGALAQADRERDSLRAERDKARAEVERIMGLLHDKAWMLAACLTIAEGGSARANEPTYLNSPAMDAVRDVVRERDSLRAERDAEQRRAMAAESERDVLREEHTARVLENSDLAHERDEAREERDSLRDQLAECQRVLALGEKVDAITKEKIARLERGVREARWLTQRSEWSPNNSGTRLSAFDWTQVEDEYDERRAAWLKEFGS